MEEISKNNQFGSLKQKAVSGAIWSGVQKFGLSIVSFLSNILLARLLMPEDYGCIGMLSIFIVISNALIYGGFVSALIQKKDTTEKDYSTVFVWNFVIAIVLYIALFIGAPYISKFYGIGKLSSVLRVQGVVLLLNGFSVIQTTILRKSLNFGKLAKINIASSVISVAIAIACAFFGWGVWALVTQQICISAINCILLWSTTAWKPRIGFSKDSFLSLFSFGSFLLLNDLINSVCDNLQGFLIGKRFTPSVMGYYTQAKKLEEVPTQSISQMVAQVTFPIYAKIQDDQKRLYQAVKNTLKLMNFVNIPLMIVLIVTALPLFTFVYSEKWIESVPYFQILCIAGLANCFQSVNYQVVSATGRSKELFLWNFVKRGTGITLMLVGLMFGVKGLLWGMVGSFYVTYIVNAKLAYKSTSYSVFQQLRDNLPIFLLAVTAGLLSYIIGIFDVNYIALLAMQIVSFTIVYLGLAYLFKFQELKEIINIVKKIVKK